ncbi:hypothetical protein Tco_0511729 [Tanacetum coccineum]
MESNNFSSTITYGDTVTIKEPRDGADDDQENPPLDRPGVLTRCTGSKTHKKSASQSAPVGEAMQSTDVFERPADQEFETGVQDEQAEEEVQHLPDWFQKPTRLPSPDHAWNKSVPAHYETEKLDWINPEGRQYPHDLRQPLPLVPNSQGRRVIPFHLHITNWNTYELVCHAEIKRRQIRQIRPLGNLALGAEATTVLCICNLKGISSGRLFKKTDHLALLLCFAVTKVEIVEWHDYKHLDWITVRRDDDVLYKFKEGDFHRLRIQDIEDMLLLLVQGNGTKSQR